MSSRGKGLTKMPKAFQAAVKAALATGWTLTTTGKGHPRLEPPRGLRDSDGNLVYGVTMPSTPSDRRSIQNTISSFRKAGIDC